MWSSGLTIADDSKTARPEGRRHEPVSFYLLPLGPITSEEKIFLAGEREAHMKGSIDYERNKGHAEEYVIY